MRTIDIKKAFIEAYYNGDRDAYLKARKADYCMVQFEWSCFIDSLCKSGEITQRQYNKVTFQEDEKS